ncbi:MAG: methylmalonyl-CoA mutase [Desulfobacterales bacterium]|nr:methylmalonyl-CoA mutase [Desulfobacterales bacterium]
MSSEVEKKNRITESKNKWEEDVLQKNLQRFGIGESPIAYYTPADLDGHDFLEDVGFPGQYPYTAGRHAFPIHVPVWGRGKTMGLGKSVRHSFGYSGYGTPEDLRDFYIQQGGGRPNIAFDLPSQIGFDSDHELAEGEVGRVGVAVDTLKDLEIIYEPFTGDSDIDKISSNWTINGNSNIILAMYCALADKRGIPWDKLKGTPQNDILKEFVARGTQLFPIEHHMRLMRDTITFCTEHMPKMNTCSIAGFHIREAGATRVQAVSFTIANAIAYFNEAINAGLDVDTFAGRFTFLNFGGGMEVLKEAAVRRAARRVWAKIMRERFGSKNSKNWVYKELGASLAGYWPMTRTRPLNNVVRVAIGAAFAAMIGEPPVCEPPYDEPLGLGHSIEARQLAADAARVVAEECKLMDVQDVLAGSYYVESLTNRYEKEIFDLIDKIDDRGGAVKAIQSGWMKDQIVQSSIDFHRRMTSGDLIQVGVNKYTEEDEIEISIPRTSPYSAERRENAEERKIESLKKLKATRDNNAVIMHLEKIENATRDKKANLVPLFIDAVKEYVSLGEICQAMKNVVGEFND